MSDFSLVVNSTHNDLGTAIYVKKIHKISNIHRDQSSRIISIKINNLRIINVYGYPVGVNHSIEKRNNLFNKYLPLHMNMGDDFCLLGDFNATIVKNEKGWFSHSLKKIINDRFN